MGFFLVSLTQITELTIRMKNVAQMENDMDRWLTDREKVSKQLETVRKRKTALEANSSNQVSYLYVAFWENCNQN